MSPNQRRKLIAFLQPLTWLGLTITLGLVYVVIGAIVFHGADIQPFRDLFGDENFFLLGLVGVATAPWVAAWPFAFWLGPKRGALAGGLAGTLVAVAAFWLKAHGMTWGLGVELLLVGTIVGGLNGAIGRLIRAPVPGNGDAPPEEEGRVSKPPVLGRFRAVWLSLALCVVTGGWFSWEAKVPLLIQTLKLEKFRAHAFGQLIQAYPKSRMAHIEALKDTYWVFQGGFLDPLDFTGRDDKDAVPALIQALKDQEVQVRGLAAEALVRIGPGAKDAMPALIEAIKDSEAQVRSSAAVALGQIGPGAKDAVPALVEVLKDPDLQVRLSAAAALVIIGSGAKEAVPVLIEALKDQEAYHRWWAAVALSQIGSAAKEAVPALTQVSQGDPDPYIRAAAAEALKKIGAGGTEKQ